MLWSDQIRRWQQLGLCALLCVTVHGPTAAQSDSTTPKQSAQTSAKQKSTHHTTSHAATKKTSSNTTKSSHSKKASKKRGQQAIDASRAREIQTALIREHYMQGEPTGAWDAATQAAMQRYQADQGWQSKTTPDSRALIKLGLGPSHDHLLNPESAMTAPAAPTDPKAGKQTPPDNNIQQQ